MRSEISIKPVQERPCNHLIRLISTTHSDLPGTDVGGNHPSKRPSSVPKKGKAPPRTPLVSTVQPEREGGTGVDGVEHSLGGDGGIDTPMQNPPRRHLTNPIGRTRRPQPKKVRKQPIPELRTDGLRVELHPPLRPNPVSHTHEHPVVSDSDRLERVRQPRGNERVVPHGGKGRGQPGKDVDAVMKNRRSLPMPNKWRSPNRPTVHVTKPLMPKTNPKQGNRSRPNHLGTDPKISNPLRPPGPRRNDDVVNPVKRPVRRVVTDHHRSRPGDPPNLVHQVVGERVVVVDDQRAHQPTPGTDPPEPDR